MLHQGCDDLSACPSSEDLKVNVLELLLQCSASQHVSPVMNINFYLCKKQGKNFVSLLLVRKINGEGQFYQSVSFRNCRLGFSNMTNENCGAL